MMESSSRQARSLTLVFDLGRFGRRGSLFGRIDVPELTINKEDDPEIRRLTCHLKQQLALRDHASFFLLLEAVCSPRGFLNSTSPPSASLLGSERPYIIPLVCDQVWAAVLKSYHFQRLKVVVKKRPFVTTATVRCRSLLPKRELKYVDMIVYFPKLLREEHIQRIAHEVFTGGMKIKPRLRKGVWPHLVRVFHPGLETREEREGYLGKLRLIYDSLKGRLASHRGSPGHSMQQHLYDSVRRDAVRTDPSESFFNLHGNRGGGGGNPTASNGSLNSSLYAMSHENIEKLVNITAVFTLEHEEVSYTQGMTDLLSPILYVMEREDDAYIVFSAMVQRISENFGTWCEGTLKKVERLRHLCEVLDPELSAYLTDIEEDAFALFFGMVLIECRREFAFDDSFHLMEVIWSAALCMRQKVDPNWSPPSPSSPTMTTGRGRGIQAFSPEGSVDLDSVPTHSEWASFMSNRSPDVIRQVFGELQTYTAVPLARSECGSITHSTLLLSHSPPPLPHHPLHSRRLLHQRPSLTDSIENETFSEDVPNLQRSSREVVVATRVNSTDIDEQRGGRRHSVQAVRNLTSELEQHSSRSDGTRRGGGGRRRWREAEVAEERQSLDDEEREKRWDEEEEEEEEEGEEEKVKYRLRAVDAIKRPHTVLGSPARDRSLTDPIRRRRVSKPVLGTEKRSSLPSNPKLLNNSSTKKEEEGEERERNVYPSSGASDVKELRLRRSCSVNDLTPDQLPGSPPYAKVAVVTQQTEMSDMSSVGSTNGGGIGGGGGGEERGGGGVGRGGERKPESSERTGTTPTKEVDVPLSEIFRENTAAVALHHVHRPSSSSYTSHHDNVTESITREDHPPSLTRDLDYPPVSPVPPFFDTLENIATRLSQPNTPPRPAANPARPTSDNIGAAAQASSNSVLPTELQTAPSITRESSLTVPFSDSFPLFICLSIIIQHRSRILQGNLDFVGLSVLLNTQAGVQNLDRTLRIARRLYERYREYQRLCFGPQFSVYEVWLDNMESLFTSSSSSAAPPAAAAGHQIHNGVHSNSRQ